MARPALCIEGSPARDCSPGSQCCKEPAERLAQKMWGLGARATCPLTPLGGCRERWAEARSQRPCWVTPSPGGRLWGSAQKGGRREPPQQGPEMGLPLGKLESLVLSWRRRPPPRSEPLPLLTEVPSSVCKDHTDRAAEASCQVQRPRRRQGRLLGKRPCRARLQAQLFQLRERPAGEGVAGVPADISSPDSRPQLPTRQAGQLEKHQRWGAACGQPDGFDLGDHGTRLGCQGADGSPGTRRGER